MSDLLISAATLSITAAAREHYFLGGSKRLVATGTDNSVTQWAEHDSKEMYFYSSGSTSAFEEGFELLTNMFL